LREELTGKGREFSGASFDRDYGLADLLPLPCTASSGRFSRKTSLR
jgi:hypothetical protein